jgi:hypothetical protein
MIFQWSTEYVRHKTLAGLERRMIERTWLFVSGDSNTAKQHVSESNGGSDG